MQLKCLPVPQHLIGKFSLSKPLLGYIRSISVSVSGLSTYGSVMSDEEVITVSNLYFHSSDLGDLAYQLACAAEQFGFVWQNSSWSFTNGSGDRPVVVMNYEALTKYGPILLDRRFHVQNGRLFAEHGVIGIPDELQGNGFSRYTNKILFEFYKACEINKIETHAGLDVGGYVWAKAGFAAINRSDVEKIIRNARQKIHGKKVFALTEDICIYLEKSVEMHYAVNGTKPFPIYQWPAILPKQVCEDLLLGEQWDGELNFDDAVQMRTFGKYVNKR